MSLTKASYSMITGAPINILDYGAVGDGTTDCTTAFQSAITYCTTNNRELYVPAGTYKITDTLTKAESFVGVNICGAGAGNSILEFSSITTPNKSCLVLIGGSGSVPNNVIEKLSFVGNQNLRAIEFQGLGGQRVRDCKLQNFLVGGLYNNSSVGSFTEFDVFENCYFGDCFYALEYQRNLGDDSFHGSGLLNCVVDAYQNAVARILINTGCKPYNAPMTAQFFVNASIPIIRHVETSRAASYYGTITIESSGAAIPTLANGYDVGLIGGISWIGNKPNWGTMSVTRYESIDVGGVLQSLDTMYVGQPIAINTATFTDFFTPVGMLRGTRLFFVYLEGTNVEVTYMLLSLTSPFGFYPTPTLIGKSVCDNGGQSGADAIFALNNTNSYLQIKQGAGPAVNVTARIVAYQLGVGAANTGVL